MKQQKLKAAIIGPGNIGIDLMIKLQRSQHIELVAMAGIVAESKGLKMAKEAGLVATAEGIDGVLTLGNVDIVFDATGAGPHLRHAPKLKEAGIFAVDLTPAAVGPYVAPTVNMDEHLLEGVCNVNMITCGGQATVPIVYAINQVASVDYAEIVATLSSKSAGPVRGRTLMSSHRRPVTHWYR